MFSRQFRAFSGLLLVVIGMRIMLRFAIIAVAFLGSAMAPLDRAFAQASASDLLVRLDQLENQVRQLTGLVEQMQYRNQQLEAALKRLQGDTESRFQELSPRGGARAAARPAAGAVAPPVAAAPPIASAPMAAPPAGRRSDAFDPTEHPDAPGAPRALGSIYGNAAPASRNGGTPRIMAEEPTDRAAGTPLDLAPAGGGSPYAAPGSGNPYAAPRAGAPGAEAIVPSARNPPSSANYAVATAPPSSSTRDSFDLGYGYLQHRDYALAEATFRDFLNKYPSDRLAADAQYWLGESYYLRQSYRDAADAFLAMSKKYETSAKAPDALLRLGQSLAALNEKELACATFGEVVRKYPRVSAGVKQSVDREQKRVHC
jgi:tol-pal system protein YbgF